MKKGLWLNRGLSFRFGTQFSTEVGVPWVVHSQKKAFQSQIQLINHIQNKYNCQIDIIIDTLSTVYNQIIIDCFKDTNHEFNFIKNMDPGLPYAFNRALFRIVDRLDQYDFLFISRNDLIFKDKLFDLISPDDNEIKFPFVMQYPIRKLKIRFPNCDQKIPMAVDAFLYFPKKHFNILDCFKKSLGDNHDFLMNAIELDESINFSPYINTYHDGDPVKDWNPLYRIVGRGETSIRISDENLKYPDDF